jgi:hypothetical protein
MMRFAVFALAATMFANSGAYAKTEASADVLELSGDYTIAVQINDRPYRLEIEPEGGAARIANPEVAKILALKPSMIGGLHSVGPVTLRAASDSVRFDIAGTKSKDRLFWFDRPASTTADGIIHPSLLPYSKIRLILGPVAAGERETTMPMEGSGVFGIGGGYGKYRYGEVDFDVSFSLKRRETLASAPVGVELAAGPGGNFAEETRQALIRFGVERPVRTMVLKQPWLLFDRPLSAVLVRVSDFGDASTIPDGAAVDQDEIVVTGKAKKKARYLVTLGRDFLSGCSSLTYDKKAKLIRLSCLP